MRGFLLLFFLLANVAYAQEVNNTQEASTTTQNTTINTTSVGNAQEWELTPDEWIRYQQLMRGINGHWYPQLSPPEVLGLNAQNNQEQQHFAEVVAKEEHDKLARELAFDRAVHQALLKLYSHEPVIKSFDLSPFNPMKNHPKNKMRLQLGDRIAFFTDLKNSFDFVMLPNLVADIKNSPGVVLDIYCVGYADDNAIRRWAKFNQIPQDLVSQGRITLNHDNGKLQKSAGQVPLPYVLLIRNGESKPVSVWNLS